ncbi:MAG: hypothetical protein ACJ72H_11580 [Candidatus Sulfotelmatobacter sp.]
MLQRFRAAARLVCAAGAIVILHVAEVRACHPVVFCSAIRICTQAPAPWGPALREGTGIGRYAKDWKRISKRSHGWRSVRHYPLIAVDGTRFNRVRN